MNIYGKKIFLRAIELYDCKTIVSMFNDPEIENLVGGWSFPISEYSQEHWLEEHYDDKINHRFIISSKDNETLGIATLTNIDWKNRSAFHGMKIAKKENRFKGIGTDTVMAIMRYAFDELQLHRLDGAWFFDNIASKTMYMKCGWKEEGERREYVYKKGAYRDLIMSGILAQEYYDLIAQNHYWDD